MKQSKETLKMEKIKIKVMPKEWVRINDHLIELVEGRSVEHDALVKAVLLEFWKTKMQKYNPNYPPKSITLSIAQAISLNRREIISEHHQIAQKLLPFL